MAATRRWTVWGCALAAGLCAACGDAGEDGAADDASAAGDPSGDPSGATGGDPTDVSPGLYCEEGQRTGEATYYAADGSGNCSFPAAPGDPLIAAMNHTDYAGSAACGACVRIDGPDGQITVRVVDRCPECPPGDIDLSEAAFTMIAAKELGRVPIAWRYVSCPVDGEIAYHFKEGSSQWWTAVQIRDHRNAIAQLEVRGEDGAWKVVPRLEYNYFVDEAGMGPGPLSFRVTDVAGNVLEDSGIPLLDAAEAPGAQQFPACAP